MRYKIITFASKRLYKKKNYEDYSKKTMFSFEENLIENEDGIRMISGSEIVDGKLISKSEALNLRHEDFLIRQYMNCSDVIIENRIKGARINSDGFYNAPNPIDEGVSLTGHKNKEQRQRLIIITGVLATMALVSMVTVIYIYSKMNTFY